MVEAVRGEKDRYEYSARGRVRNRCKEDVIEIAFGKKKE